MRFSGLCILKNRVKQSIELKKSHRSPRMRCLRSSGSDWVRNVWGKFYLRRAPFGARTLRDSVSSKSTFVSYVPEGRATSLKLLFLRFPFSPRRVFFLVPPRSYCLRPGRVSSLSWCERDNLFMRITCSGDLGTGTADPVIRRVRNLIRTALPMKYSSPGG